MTRMCPKTAIIITYVLTYYDYYLPKQSDDDKSLSYNSQPQGVPQVS